MTKQCLWLVALALGAGTGCAAAGGSESAGNSPSYGVDAAGTWSPGIGGAQGAGGSTGMVLSFDAGAAGPKMDAAILPPEQEKNVDFLAPQAGARYVYVANPTRNTVSVIDSKTLTIVERAPGDSPTYMATIPGQDVALVINVGSHTLRVLSGDELAGDPIKIVTKANAIAIAPDGRHAVIWFDASRSSVTTTSSTTTTSTTGSTQEVSVVTLTPATTTTPAAGTVISMSVGYNPSAVVFSSDSAAAFVVTDDGISELRFADISKPGIAPFTSIDNTLTSVARPDAGSAVPPDAATASPSATPPAPPAAGDVDAGPELDGGSALDGGPSSDARPPSSDGGLDLAPPDTMTPATPDTAPVAPAVNLTGKPVDVSVTPDGTYAIARRDLSAQILLANLNTGKVTALNMTSQVTDLDLLPSGTAAFAVLRAESLLVRIEIPGGFFDESKRTTWPLQDTDIGSVTMSAQGKYALLYTTAVPSDSLTIFVPTSTEYRTLHLNRPVRAVAVTPDENTALVLHPAPTTAGAAGTGGTGGSSGAGGSSGTANNSYGYTLVRLEDGYKKFLQTSADPNPFAITPDSSHAFVLLRDDKASVRIAERIDLTSYIPDDFQLGSPPNSIAALGDLTNHKVFVGQVYPEGRISFIDWMTGDVQTVTGFALNGRIQQ
jgi:hypothetical protein